MSKYFNPYTDFGFKKLFGEEANKDLAITTAEKKGKAKGRVEGRIKGRAERDLEIARNMKNEGFDPAMIAKMTGLSLEKIKRLK